MNKCSSVIESIGIIPVINITDIEAAKPLASVLLEEGIKTIEVTLRSDCSLWAIAEIKKNFKEMLVGAGTVLDCKTVDKAIAAGADYIVSPGYDDEIVDYCLNKNIEIFPGCTSASEIQKAYKKGLRILKFFPAELNGGVDAIKLLSGPFKGIKFIPTGGINYTNLDKYLSCSAVAACGGSFMATSDQLKNKDFDGIREACKKAIDISLGFEFAHIGINHDTEEKAMNTSNDLVSLFRLTEKDGNSSIFSGSNVECMKSKYYGEKGHIGFKTNSVQRAVAWFESQGCAVIDESIKRKPDGSILSAYINKEVGGFALHIIQK